MPCARAVWDDLRSKPVCVSQGSSFTKPLLNDYGAKTHGYKSSAESLQALRGSHCVAAVQDSTLIHPTLLRNAEWADHEAPLTTEVLSAFSVAWTRKGEADTTAAVDRVVQEWHRSALLISVWTLRLERRALAQPDNLLQSSACCVTVPSGEARCYASFA